ncbi:MAG: SAM-dependent chlorinase/fluorinase [Bacteroidota bacterium]
MGLITFLSDFGLEDHYVASVKSELLKVNPTQIIVDISHEVPPFDIARAAFLLSSVYLDFPQGTVHIAAVDTVKRRSRIVAVELHGHYFIGYDSGLFSLLENREPDQAFELAKIGGTFPVKETMAPIAASLANGSSINTLGYESTQIMMLYGRQLKVTKREIVGNVVAIDRFGNLISNVSKEAFDKMMEINGEGTKYLLRFGREAMNQLHTYFTAVESGDCYAFFNSSGVLQIGINQGNAAQLLGLKMDAPVFIEFTAS